MSNQSQAPNQAVLHTDSPRSQKPAKAGATPRTSPEYASQTPAASQSEQKAIPVSALHFERIVKLDTLGTFCCLKSGKPPDGFSKRTDTVYVDSIFEYKGKYLVNARYWIMPSAIFGIEY